ncbi:hypothetical protein [Streptomyces sp. NPDC001530]|uniref:hypothetical protein n=1 Tax=Streptomyces sp. NPDC001530 TaxID=3364582 RepID=UPI0036CD79F8
MATFRVYGPFNWSTLHDPLLPGQAVAWSLGPFSPKIFSGAISVSAHPSGANAHQALAIETLSTAYARDTVGGAATNFYVKNVSDTAVWAYRVFVGVIDVA